jgi:hypothetical protein
MGGPQQGVRLLYCLGAHDNSHRLNQVWLTKEGHKFCRNRLGVARAMVR